MSDTRKTEEEIRERLKQAELEVEDEAACYDPASIALAKTEATVAALRWVLGE